MNNTLIVRKIIFSILILLFAFSALIPQYACTETDPQVYTTVVPVKITGAENIGTLHIELLYDDRIVTPVSVGKGNIVGSGLFSYGIDTASVIIIGITGVALNGDGTIAEIKLKVNGTTLLPTDLVLTNIIGRDALTNIKKDLDFTNGSIDPQKRTFTPPVIISLKQ